MFNILNSLTATNDDIARLYVKYTNLVKTNEKLGLSLMMFENEKQEVQYFKNKMLCAEQIEKALREQLEENQLKLKAYKNFTEIVNACCERTTNEKVGIDFDYSESKKRKGASRKNKGISNGKEVVS